MSGFIIAGEAVSKPTMAAPATSTTAGNLRVAEPTGVAQPGTRGGDAGEKAILSLEACSFAGKTEAGGRPREGAYHSGEY